MRLLLVLFFNLLALGCIAVVIRKKSDAALRKFFWPSLLIKCVAGIALGLVYMYYYTANDTFLFFKDATILNELGRTDLFQYVSFLWSSDESFPVWNQLTHGEPRSVFFVKIVSLINWLTASNYWISSLWLSFLSFTGCWYLFIRWNDFFKDNEWPPALALFFFPSFVFWGSGIIKESISVGGLCFIAGVFLLLIHKRKPQFIEWVLMIASVYIVWSLKYYWAAVLIPVISTSLIFVYGVNKVGEIKNKLAEAGVWLLIFFCLCMGVSFVHPNFYLERLLYVIVANHDVFINVSAFNGVIHFHQLTATWPSILINAPWALISGLFRPFLFETANAFQVVIALENAVLLVFFVFRFANSKSTFGVNRILVYSAIVYVIVLCIFLALSTPNFGTLSRYRAGFLPVFCLLIFNQNRLLHFIKPKEKIV